MHAKLLLLLMVWCMAAQAQKVKPAKAHQPKERPDKYYVYCPAEYPGGTDSLTKHIERNIRYPEAAREAGVQGRVRVKFFINEEGCATDAVVVRSIGAGCDEEAVRVAITICNWQPATFNGKPVKSLYYLPISFRLE